MKPWIKVVAAAALIAGVAAPSVLLWRDGVAERAAVAAQERTTARLQAEVSSLTAQLGGDPSWVTIAADVEPSVVTIETDTDLGSGWVIRSGPSGSDIVTNFHVVADAWSDGRQDVVVKRKDASLPGTIVKVDTQDDLALVHTAARLPALPVQTLRPGLGSTVMAVGSPLGLDGTVTVGVVSGYRSLDGSDYLQFSAAISPGNSGGPVLDSRGRVVAVASAKLVGDGVEALSLGIPVATVCTALLSCQAA